MLLVPSVQSFIHEWSYGVPTLYTNFVMREEDCFKVKNKNKYAVSEALPTLHCLLYSVKCMNVRFIFGGNRGSMDD